MSFFESSRILALRRPFLWPWLSTDLDQILASPTLVLLSETGRHAEVMATVVRESGVTGNLLHDAHIAALCIEHGVSELVTGERDFSRFRMPITNPFR